MTMSAKGRSRAWRVATLWALLLVASGAQADEGGAAPVKQADDACFAVAPGNEALISDMFGAEDALPGGCHWDGAEVKETYVVLHYRCAVGPVVLELRHPSKASEASARTSKFAIERGANGTAPQELIDAVAARARSKESAWRWIEVSPGVAPPPVRVKAVVLVGLGAVLLGLALLGWGALAWRGWRRDTTERTRGEVVREWLIGAVFGVLGGALAWGVLRGMGEALSLVLRGGGVGVALMPFAKAMGCTMALPLVWFAWERRPGSRPAVYGLLLVPLLLGGWRYTADPFPDLGAPFGSLRAHTPNASIIEHSPLRPRITYHMNRYGFRGPDWSVERAPGVTRVVLIGDSFVFGSGVEEQDTLSEQLRRDLEARHPERRYEVLNLGIAGNNLGSHVEFYRTASALLHPDAAVLCFTEQNDLTPTDDQDMRRWFSSPSPFSAAAFFFGRDAAQAAWWDLTLVTSIGPENLRFLDEKLDELARLRAGGGAPLWVFPFQFPDGMLREHLTARPGVAIIPGVPSKPEYFIPGDGHPTALGNQHFAAQIAASLDETASSLH